MWAVCSTSFHKLDASCSYLESQHPPKRGRREEGNSCACSAGGGGGVEGAASVASSFHTSQLAYEAKGCSLKMGTLQPAV